MPPIVRHQKYLYDFPQVSKCFDDHLSFRLIASGFTRCISDAKVFILSRGGKQVILPKHVDNCLLAAIRGSELLNFVSRELSNPIRGLRQSSQSIL